MALRRGAVSGLRGVLLLMGLTAALFAVFVGYYQVWRRAYPHAYCFLPL